MFVLFVSNGSTLQSGATYFPIANDIYLLLDKFIFLFFNKSSSFIPALW